MSAYFIANIRMKDPQIYEKYLEGCDEVFEKYNGEYLAVDEKTVVLEGEWPYTKAVIIRFPCEADLRRWYDSDEYQKLVKYRLEAAYCDTIIVHGAK